MVLTNNKDNIYIKDSEELSNKDLNIHSVLQFLSEYKVERKNTVVNLSTRDFTPAEVSVLAKGLNYCPIPGEPVLGEKYEDLERFHNNLRWKHHFSSQTPTKPGTSLEELVKRSNIFRPTTGPKAPPGSSVLETFIILNEIELTKSTTICPKQHNLTRAEKDAVSTLAKDNEIVIKPADKGGAVVIQNTTDYITEAKSQLNDRKYYHQVDHDLTEEYTSQVNQYLIGLHQKREITYRVLKRSTTEKWKTPQFYMLPKIHKLKRPPPGRPIVSANGCATERISALVDIILRPIVPKTRSYLKDTGHFLQKLANYHGVITPNTLLVSLDVSALYTNIPNEEGRRAVARWLTKYRPAALIREGEPSNKTVLTLLKMVLELNNFDFNGEHFLQVGGTAMGTRVAPTLANLFMADFEERFVYTYHTQPKLWGRFIDDIFLIWDSGEAELMDFIKHLNSVHDSIKFTHEISKNAIPFLDTVVKIHNGTLTTDLHNKDTDAHNYLHYCSSHPLPLQKGYPLRPVFTSQTYLHQGRGLH